MSDFNAGENLKALSMGSSEKVVRDTLRWEGNWHTHTAAATTTAIGEEAAHRVKQKCRLVACQFMAYAAVTAGATNFFTLTIRKRTAAAPGTQVALIAYAADTTTTDDAAAFTAKDLMTTTYISSGVAPGTEFNFAEGDIVTCEVTKAGTGMTFPISSVQLVFEPRD